jgi:hypothetical protein
MEIFKRNHALIVHRRDVWELEEIPNNDYWDIAPPLQATPDQSKLQ